MEKTQKTTYMYIGFERSEMTFFFNPFGLALYREDLRWYSSNQK